MPMTTVAAALRIMFRLQINECLRAARGDGRGDGAELEQHRQKVIDGPTINDAVVRDPVHEGSASLAMADLLAMRSIMPWLNAASGPPTGWATNAPTWPPKPQAPV